jgi:mxaA protein
MRDTGYTLGDLILSHVSIRLEPGAEIDPDSLPPAGRVTPWLELREARLQQSGNTAHLDLTWQVFATVESPLVLKLPALELKLKGDRPQVVVIPAQPFHLSPVLPNPLENTQARPNRPPFLFDAQTPLLAAALSCLLALLCGTVWLWLVDRLPGFPRHPGPFTRLARRLRKHKGELDMQVLRDIHAALNTAAGETLYPGTLSRLFQHAPHLEAVRADLELFFHASWQYFYANGSALPDRNQTLAWVERAASAERLP